HPISIRAKWGATREGKIVAAEATIVGDAGAYAYTTPKVMGNANLCATGPYEIPNIHLDTFGVFTNNPLTGAFRGFGGPQGAFAAEGQMNKLAEVLNIDVVELRRRNLFQDGSIASVGTPLPKGVSIREVVAECARESYWAIGKNGVWERPPIE